jgi:hypothetical protein
MVDPQIAFKVSVVPVWAEAECFDAIKVGAAVVISFGECSIFPGVFDQ